MKINSTQFAKIFNIAWQMLMDHATEETPELYMDEKEKTLTWIDDRYPVVTQEEAKIRLSAWIQELTDQEPDLIIYTCKDNYEISLYNIEGAKKHGIWDERGPEYNGCEKIETIAGITIYGAFD